MSERQKIRQAETQTGAQPATQPNGSNRGRPGGFRHRKRIPPGIHEFCRLPLSCFDSQSLRIQDVNNAALSIFGYSRNEFLSLTFADISAEPSSALARIPGPEGSDTDRMPLHQFRKKDGSAITGALHIGTWVSEDGAPSTDCQRGRYDPPEGCGRGAEKTPKKI